MRSFVLLMSLLSLFAGGITLHQQVQAQCTGGTPADDTITCPGGTTDPDGIVSRDGDDTIIVEENATVINDNATVVDTTGSNTIINNGTVESTQNVAIGNLGEDTTTVNNGSATGATAGVYNGASDDSQITNTGEVTGGTEGIDSNATGASLVTNTGTVAGEGGDGIQSASRRENSTVVNTGTVQGDDDGIDSGGQTSTVINTGTVTGSGSDPQNIGIVSAGASSSHVENTGSVEGDNIGIASLSNGSSTITNTGTTSGDIAVYSQGAANTIENTGTVEGNLTGIYVVGSGNVTNTGTVTSADSTIATIQSTSGIDVENYGTVSNTGGGDAINLGNGSNTLTQQADGTVQGNLNGGAGTDTLTFVYTFDAEDFYIPAEYEAIRQQLLNAPTAGCPCTLSLKVGGRTFTYTHTNFENFDSFLRFIKITFTPYDTINCQNGVKCFALKNKGFRNGNVQIYAAEGDQGVAVATVNFLLLGTGGYTFTHETNGWTVTITYLGAEGDAHTYSITLSKGTEVRHAMTTIQVFAHDDENPSTNALAWR